MQQLRDSSVLCDASLYLSDALIGTINTEKGATSLDDCTPCKAGYYCAGPAAFVETGQVDGGFYSISGALSAKPVPGCRILAALAGVRTTACKGLESPILSFSAATAKCLESDECQGIVETPEKTFLLRGGSADTDCLKCPAGYYCDTTGLSSPAGACPAGKYCPEGTDSPTNAKDCTTGHMCPEGSAAPVPCPRGTKQPGEGQASCISCDAGYYCPAGTKWKEPTTFCKHGEVCPPGSAAPQDCPPNHFCNTIKLAEPSGPCSGGFICTSRSTSPRPTGEENGTACEEKMSGRPCPESPLIAGTGFAGSGGDGLPGPETLLMLPANARMDSATGDIYFADYSNYAVKVVHGETGRNAIVEHDVALRSSALMSKISTQISKPLGLDIDADCSFLYIADSGNHRVVKHKLAEAQDTNTVIGTGTAGKSDATSNVAPSSFQINMPSGVALYNAKVYVVDSGNKRVLEVDTSSNVVKELPGSGASITKGQSSNSSGVIFERPVSAAIVDRESDIVLVVADLDARALRKIDLQTNTISTLIDYSAWRSPVVNDAEKSIATTGIEEAFYGISSFYGENNKRTGVLLADSYTHRIRRIELQGNLYARSAVSDVPCPEAPLDLSNLKGRVLKAIIVPKGRNLLPNTSVLKAITALHIQAKCPNRAAGSQKEEEVFVVDLDEPTDLAGILIQLEGGHIPTGYYCKAGSWTATPLAGMVHPETGETLDIGGICPPNHYCTEGVSEPTPCPQCPSGTFSSEGQASCTPCSPGTYCQNPGNTKDGTACPEGHFCGEQTIVPQPCKPGTFQDQEGQSSCKLCPRGMYCPDYRATSATQKCYAGTICVAGAAHPRIVDQVYSFENEVFPRGKPEEHRAYHAQRASIVLERATHPPQETALPDMSATEVLRQANPQTGLKAKVARKDFTAKKGPPTRSHAHPAHTPERRDNAPVSPAQKGSTAMLLARIQWSAPRERYVLKEVQSLASALEALCLIKTLMSLMLAFHVHGENIAGELPKLGTALQGAKEPQPCPGGSVRQANLGRFYCPALSLVPEPCPAGHFCPLGSSEPRPCIGGTYNPYQEGSGTASCLICVPGYLCPGEGTGELTKENQCPTGHYCLEGSQQAIPCPPGTYADERGLSIHATSAPPLNACALSGELLGLGALPGVANRNRAQLELCVRAFVCTCIAAVVKGTYSSEPGMTECLPCTPGYVCLEGCNSRTPTSRSRDKGFRCAPGTYCPEGSSSETPCPPGTYGLQAAASSQEACYSCPSGTYNSLEGQTGCILCGATATSNSKATSCSCKGTNRAFQLADRSCVCVSGFHYTQGKEDLSDQDGVEPCQQTLYDECTSETVRDSTGACSTSKEVCSSQCGPAGGSFSTISGLCSCVGEKSLDEICDETCRSTRPQMIIKDSKLLIDDPETTSGDRAFALQDLTTQTGLATGSYECEDRAGCTVRMFDTTLAKMTGLVGVPQSFVDDITERLQEFGIAPELPSEEETEDTDGTEVDGTDPTRRLAASSDFGYYGVSDPVQCLPLGSTVAWHIRPSPNPIYPVYLRNNLLNTNQQFDYGAFRELDTDMKGGEQRILFMFTFKEPGLYVFGLNSDQNKILVLRVMESKRLCREDALLPQLRTAETLAAIAARLPATIETSGWLLFIAVVLGIICMAVLLFLAAWTIKHQRLEKLEADPKSKYNQRTLHETPTKEALREVEDLIIQNQAQAPMEEDPGVLRARRALAKKLETQDPRLFIAVLNLAKRIQQEAEQQCGQILDERSQGLSQLRELTKQLKQALSQQLQDAAASEVRLGQTGGVVFGETLSIWGKEHDEEREEVLSTLLSLLRLRRRDLVNKLAREEKEHQKEEALRGRGEQLLLLRQASGMWSRKDSLVSSIILPAVGEKGHTQISSIKLSVEKQVEELLEEFRKARADADDDMPSVIEIYKAKMKSILEEAQGETNLAFKSMLSADIEGHLITGSDLLELREAKANLTRTEDEAEERKALEIYRVLAEAAWKLSVYTAVIEQEIASSTQAVNKAAFEGKQAVEITKMNSGEAANALKVAVMASLKEGRSRIQEAAEAAEKAIFSAEAEALSQLDSWTENYQAELRDMYDAIIDAQNRTITSAFATESHLLRQSMQTMKNQILERIRTRYDKIHSVKCSAILEELQVTLDASISERSLKTRQKFIDDAVNEASDELNRLRDAELESATAALNHIIALRTESVTKRQSAFKSRKLLMLQKRQEVAVQQVPTQAQCAVALIRRGLHILTQQLKAATTYEATLFQNVAKFGVDMAALIMENTEDISAPASLLEDLKTQQSEALAKYRDQLFACLRNQRQEATEELWDLELRERKRIAELLEEQTEQLEGASNKLEEATAKEETVRDEYENTVLELRQQNQRGLKELHSIQALSAFKQKLLSKVNNTFLSRANEARRKGIDDPETEDRLLQEWRLAAAELEPLIVREKETYCRYADTAFQAEKENAQRVLQNSRHNRLSQTGLTKSMEQAEEDGDDDLLHKRRALGTDEVQRIIWRICALLSSGGLASTDTSKLHLVVPENRRDETVEELRQQLRRRRKRHLDYCMAQRNIIEGSSKSALAVLQSETIQGLSDTSEAIEEFSRGSATVDAAKSSEAILEIMKKAQQKLDQALEEIQKEQEEAEERDRIEREQEVAERKRAHELAKQKLNEDHEAKLAQVPEDSREELLKEHEAALKEMESTVAAELLEQEQRAQQRLLERQQRLQQKRREAEEQKQREIEQAKAELEAKIAAEAKEKEEAAEFDELQRLVNEGSNTAAVAELLARKHEKELSAILQELSMKKAEEISALTENFWKEKGGRICEGRPDDVQELYKAELQEYLFVQTQAVDDRITLELQERQQQQAAETEAIMKQMERRTKLAREREQPQMSEEEQYAKLQQEAEAAAAEEVGAIEKRMMEEQEKLLKEMEEKRNAYDKMLDKLKHRKQVDEKRRALRQEQEQRMREEGQGNGLKHLMSQFEEHRKLLEEALAVEAERQHKQARERVLLRNAERCDRLYQKRLVEKQRFLVNQNEIKRRELGLNNARAGVRSQRNLVETLNQQELKRRMELAHRLEEERHWAPIWREILEEEQNAGTFDSWDLDDEQINFAGPFATNLLHTERMLQSEGTYMRKLIGGFQQLSDLISLINTASQEEASGALKQSHKQLSSSTSSHEDDSSESTDSATSERSSSDESSDSESEESEPQVSSDTSSEEEDEKVSSSSSEESSDSSSGSSSSGSSDDTSSNNSSTSESDDDSD
ncbi:Cast multi-domain protein, related [Eimeria mitis]|uniref:Cast multi-domain protein, related n=1 Tax=Eimeria mitis TaxID=44415 RepID=U6JUN4_9EIME|nr:Cast multi-domain protein, related [Eimeria mitis]CDJ29124.1 Cast multi-domain protein, related [Eimeria mitis]